MDTLQHDAPVIPTLDSLRQKISDSTADTLFTMPVSTEAAVTEAFSGGSQETVSANSYEEALRKQFTIAALDDAVEAMEEQMREADEPGWTDPRSPQQRALRFLKHRSATIQNEG